MFKLTPQSPLIFPLAVIACLLFSIWFVPVLAQDSQVDSAVRTNQYANLEALVNINANLAEILGFVFAGNFLFGAVAVLIKKRWIAGVILFLLIPTFITIGLGTPMTYTSLIEANRETGLMFSSCIAVVLFFLYLGMIFLPAIIALVRKHRYKWIIFGVNFIAFIPFAWPVLMFFAYHDPNEDGSYG